jgi:hypothetical protein
MAKKSSESSQPVGLKSVKSADIKNRQWTDRERRAVYNVSQRQAESDGYPETDGRAIGKKCCDSVT